MKRKLITLFLIFCPIFSVEAEPGASSFSVHGNWIGGKQPPAAHTYVEVFIKKSSDGWLPLTDGVTAKELENDDVERLMVSPTRKMIFTTFLTDTKHQSVQGAYVGDMKIVAGNVESMKCASRMFPHSRGYYLCNSAFGHTDLAGAAVENTLYTVLTGGLSLLAGKAVYLVTLDHQKIIDAVTSPAVLGYLTRKEQLQIQAYQKAYEQEFQNAVTEDQLSSFVSKYGSEDQDGLVAKASSKLKLLRYKNDYARVVANKSVASLTEFIKRYADFDPDGVLPSLSKQLSLEKDREDRIARQQQEVAMKLAEAARSKIEVGDGVCTDGEVDRAGLKLKGGAYGYAEGFGRDRKRIKVRLKHIMVKEPVPLGLLDTNWRIRNFEIIPDSIIWDDLANWLPCDVKFD